MKRAVLLLGLCGLVAACGSPSGPSPRESGRMVEEDEDPSQPPKEARLELPALPQDGDLVQFYPGPVGSHRYYIDAKTLVVGQDGIVRYAMVMRTSGGATNMSYEGIRCQTREMRLYAIGYPGKGWVEAKRSNWEPIRGGRVNEHQSFLASEYFCAEGRTPSSKSSILSAMRQGLGGPPPHRGDR